MVSSVMSWPRPVGFKKGKPEPGSEIRESFPEGFLLGVLGIVVLPHAFHLSALHLGLFYGLLLWRWWCIRHPQNLPKHRLLVLITLVAGGLVAVSSRGSLDLETSTGLLLVGLGLKIMELNRHRDFYVAIFLGFFAALTQFLYDQSMVMAAYALVATVLLTAMLVALNLPFRTNRRLPLVIAARMVIFALPCMVVLFVLFPRLTGPFWRLPITHHQGVTGLSPILEPGAVSRLAPSSEIAFRVEFEDQLPPAKDRYWRAQVFWHFDGRRWDSLPALRTHSTPQIVTGMEKKYQYTVTLEPHNQAWLFALGIPATVPGNAILTQDMTLRSKTKVNERLRYRVTSFAQSFPTTLSAQEKRWALQLPSRPSQKIQRLVNDWQQSNSSTGEIARSALRYFQENDFVYTLNPPLMKGDFIDQFLFEYRQGFCEHYAAAFVYIMRVAGIPARVVGGYMGGYYNPLGKFLEVYQSNAHAWAEVWIDGKGWTRYDPTQVVAPAYLQQTLEMPVAAFLDRLRFKRISGDLTDHGKPQFFSRVANRIQNFFAALDHNWHRWILEYDNQKQQVAWQWLAQVKTLLSVMAGTLIVSGTFCWLMIRRRKQEVPAVRLYRRFVQTMAKRGILKQSHETPSMFALRAGRHFPKKAALFQSITEEFLSLRYGHKRNIQRLKSLTSQL